MCEACKFICENFDKLKDFFVFCGIMTIVFFVIAIFITVFVCHRIWGEKKSVKIFAELCKKYIDETIESKSETGKNKQKTIRGALDSLENVIVSGE